MASSETKRILFVLWWGGGNTTPVRVLARRLTEAGHEVGVLGPERLRAEMTAAGALMHLCDEGKQAVELEAAVAWFAPDLVVVDFMMPDVLTEAEASGQRFAALIHTLAAGIVDRSAPLMGAFHGLDSINERRAALGLPAVGAVEDLLDRTVGVLAAMPEAIDRPAPGAPTSVTYLGALLDAAPPALVSLNAAAMVVLSMGTTDMGEVEVAQRVMASLDGEPLKVRATFGDHVDPTSVLRGGNATVTGLEPHASLLPTADVLVSHAGLGTVIAGAVFGVPQVCVPLGRDQPANADRVVDLGIGVRLDPGASGEEMRDTIRAVMVDEAYRTRAAELAARIKSMQPDPVSILTALT